MFSKRGAPRARAAFLKELDLVNRLRARAGHSFFFEGLRQLQPRRLQALSLDHEPLQLDLELA
jgi:hypothetical protein